MTVLVIVCVAQLLGGRINPARAEKGLPPFEILPGAYEACDESELP